MFNRNKQSMSATGDTGEDIGRIYNAIKECAKIGVDERVILAIIMQESHGDVGVQTTFSPGDNIPTGGVMQCSGCAGHPGKHGLSQVCAFSSLSMRWRRMKCTSNGLKKPS